MASHPHGKELERYVTRVLADGCAVLELFLGDETELGTTEIARRLSLSKNRVFRILSSLEFCGFVEFNENSERYRLGRKIHKLGLAYERENPHDVVRVQACIEDRRSKLHGTVTFLQLTDGKAPDQVQEELEAMMSTVVSAVRKNL